LHGFFSGGAAKSKPGMSARERFSINVLENSSHEILLLKRSMDTALGPGLWGFPAGHIMAGESPQACSRRELDEEIGQQHVLELVNSLGPVPDTYYGGRYEIFLYHYRWLGGDIRLNHEHTDYAWVGRRDFKNYEVMYGIDEDLLYLEIWPRQYLNESRLPRK
jgi:8-oxo-dGTP diphosphatase